MYLEECYPEEHHSFISAIGGSRVTPRVFVSDAPITWSVGGLDSSIITSSEVAAKESKAHAEARGAIHPTVGAFLESLSELPNGAAAIHATAKKLSHVHVETRGSRQHDSCDDSTQKSTTAMVNFADGGKGAVHRCDPARDLIKVSDESFSAGNWLENTHEGKQISSGLQIMHRPFLTATHIDQFGVFSWMKQLAGVSLFAVWSLEDGMQHQLTEASDGLVEGEDGRDMRKRWDGDEWGRFFQMSSARLMLLVPGDIGFIKSGAFHRVFTLQSKVVAYFNYLDGHTFAEALPSIDRDMQRVLKLCNLFLEGLQYEAKRLGMQKAPHLSELLEFVPKQRNSQEMCLDFMEQMKEYARSESGMDTLALACEELQGQRPLPKINLVYLFSRLVEVHMKASMSMPGPGGGSSSGR